MFTVFKLNTSMWLLGSIAGAQTSKFWLMRNTNISERSLLHVDVVVVVFAYDFPKPSINWFPYSVNSKQRQILKGLPARHLICDVL